MWSPGPTAAVLLGVASFALLFGLGLLIHSKGKGLHAGVGGSLALVGLGYATGTLGLLTWIPDTSLLCLGLVLQLLQPAGLFWVSALVLGAAASPERAAARRRAWAVSVLCLISAGLAWTSTTIEVGLSASGAPLVAFGSLGRMVFGAHVVLLALGISQFEALLRAVGYPLRYSLKFFLPALVATAVYQIFFASQILLLQSSPLDRTLPSLVLMAVALVLLGLGLRAERGAPKAPLYVAPRFVFGSVTFLVIGLYLLAVGALGDLLRKVLPRVGVDLSEALVLLALLGLAVALLSRTAQTEMRRFVATRFYRSRYDYREKWLEVTDAFEACRTADSILDRLIDVLARTFGTGHLSVWMVFEADGRFHQVRSTNIEAAPPPMDASHPLVRALIAGDGPLDVQPGTASEPGGQDSRAFVEVTRAVLCVPVRSQGELIAFVALGPERGGEAYEIDDRNLLRAITHHAGVLLSHARLAEERRGAAEIEALHRVSAFCVHDLKNLAASLSLVARNTETHGSDPVFQESALRTVARTADKIMALVHRLSRRSSDVAQAGPVDLGQAIDEALASLNGALRANVRREGPSVPSVAARKEELHQVLLNLVLNAADALAEGGSGRTAEGIVVRTGVEGDRVILSVADSGPGLAPGMLRTLFQPFRTTKSGGLGLGLYECKRIVEAHHGRIRVRSEPGQGTEFVVELPAWRQAKQAPR
jgi:hypothetical protein